MRIVGGRLAGRDLHSPRDRRVRPTQEHVRAALLELLVEDVPGARVLDLFAGTGALGLEALSRGAASCDFVEFAPGSLSALRSNLVTLKLTKKGRVMPQEAIPFVEALPAGAYDVVMADPPYESRILDRVLAAWRAVPFAPVLALEHAASHTLPGKAKRVRYGDTMLSVYRTARARGDVAPSER
jgi:16S rRNA (guanine966-N2)-methyltransferase